MNADIEESLAEGQPIWPKEQEILRIDPAIAMTRFEDMLPFHGGLVDYLMAREAEKLAEGVKQTGAAGGIKVYHIDSWPVPGARLLARSWAKPLRPSISLGAMSTGPETTSCRTRTGAPRVPWSICSRSATAIPRNR
jgi:hypothetical protein